MVTIYALINPGNNEPFYIGSTNQKLSYRLSAHNRNHEGLPARRMIIESIKQDGQTIGIIPLLVCSDKAAQKAEPYIYNLLVTHGYSLLQDKCRLLRQNCPYYIRKRLNYLIRDGRAIFIFATIDATYPGWAPPSHSLPYQ